MFNKLRQSKRGVSEVLAVVIILGLVLAASGIVAVVLLNVDDINFPGSVDTTTKFETVKLSIELISKNDTDLDTFYDTLTLSISLDVDSPSIYVKDIDLLLPTGNSLDDIIPWVIVSSTQTWYEEIKGFAIPYGSINCSFILEPKTLSQTEGEIENGSSLYFVIFYSYLSQTGSRIDTVSGFYQSSLFVMS